MKEKALFFISLVADVLVSLFYGGTRHLPGFKVLGSVFFLQKVLGFNRCLAWPCHFTSKVIYRNRISLGARSFPGWSPGCYIQARNGIVIGNNLRMGPNVGLISSNHCVNDYDRWLEEGPIEIGNNVWLGMGVLVLPSVKIGDNVIVAAGAVVSRDIPSNSIAAGSPAKVISSKSSYQGVEYW